MTSKKLISTIGCIVFFFFGSCSTYQKPYLVIQACFKNEFDKSLVLRSMIKQTATELNLSAVDHSAETIQQLEISQSDGKNSNKVTQSINMGLDRGKITKLVVSDLGLGEREVLFSFFGNPRDTKDFRLSKNIVGKLSKFGTFKEISVHEGARADGKCAL